MTADELLTKTDLEKAVCSLKHDLLNSIQTMLGGGGVAGKQVLNVKQAAEYLKCAIPFASALNGVKSPIRKTVVT